jgi:hypothetical protein
MRYDARYYSAASLIVRGRQATTSFVVDGMHLIYEALNKTGGNADGSGSIDIGPRGLSQAMPFIAAIKASPATS